MEVQQRAIRPTESGRGAVPAVFVDKCSSLGWTDQYEIETLCYSNDVHSLETLAAHSGVRCFSGQQRGTIEVANVGHALERSHVACVDGNLLQSASWLITAAQLTQERVARDRHLKRATRELLVALDPHGALVICHAADPLLFDGEWTYLLGRVAGLHGRADVSLRLLENAWEQLAVTSNERLRESSSVDLGGEALCRDICSHALAVCTSIGNHEALAQWINNEGSVAATAGDDALNDVDVNSRRHIAALLGDYADVSHNPEPSAPLNGALGSAVTRLTCGDTHTALEFIDADIAASTKIGNVAQRTYGNAWKSVIELRRGNWAGAHTLPTTDSLAGGQHAKAFAACGAIARAAVFATTLVDNQADSLQSVDTLVAELPTAIPLIASRDQLFGWNDLLRLHLPSAIAYAQRWSESRWGTLWMFGGPPLAVVGSLAATIVGDEETAQALSEPLISSLDPFCRRWANRIRGQTPTSTTEETALLDQFLATVLDRAIEFHATGNRGIETLNTYDTTKPVDAPVLLHVIDELPFVLNRYRTLKQIDSMSPMQRAVLDKVVAGSSNQQVASALHISVKSVEFHLTSIYRLLHIASRNELSATVASIGEHTLPRVASADVFFSE